LHPPGQATTGRRRAYAAALHPTRSSNPTGHRYKVTLSRKKIHRTVRLVSQEFFFIFSPNLKQILNLTRLSKKF
jgi:hypothetical protein